MTDYHDNFFDENRPWSKLKNSILGSYMKPYMAKVNRRPERIRLVDAFAGRGKMSTGDPGSPLIICSAAERYAKGKYSALFANIKANEHEELTSILSAGGYIPSAKTVFADAIDQIRNLTENLGDETLFLYIDPFGLDVEFDVLQPLLNRDNRYSTEIFINLNMPGIHRLASRNAWLSGQGDQDAIERHHEKLTRTLGGEYWKDVFLNDKAIDTKDRERRLVTLYRERLSSTGYLNFTGACPVREKIESQTKYHMVFASPHPDALLLINDAMCNAFNKYMHEQWVKDTLFAESPWSEWRLPEKLRRIVLSYIGRHESDTRLDLWRRIVRDHFMLFTSSEYRQAVQSMYNTGRLECVTPIAKGGARPTKRLNDNCVFVVPQQQAMF